VRFALLGGTLVIALLGAGSAASGPTIVSLLLLLLGAVAFHNFTYVLNDLIDLPIDHTEPRRASSPLVRGIVRPEQALLFMILQIPIPFLVTAVLSGNFAAHLLMEAALLLMSIYNLWGKSNAYPILTDVAQGLSWGFLGAWAALAMGGRLTPLTTVLFSYVMVYILLINGVHGSLRDLPNDWRYGVRSTAVFLGARLAGEGILIPRRLRRYACLLQLLLSAIIFSSLAVNGFDYGMPVWAVTFAVEIILAFFCWRWLNQALDRAGPPSPQRRRPQLNS
jgi:4-hydroxybenzoate polyprenyltransferase